METNKDQVDRGLAESRGLVDSWTRGPGGLMGMMGTIVGKEPPEGGRSCRQIPRRTDVAHCADCRVMQRVSKDFLFP